MIGSARERGFTLSEMLVVCAIIAVLIVVTLPSIIAHRKAAYETDVLAGMRRIVEAEEIFRVQDMDQDRVTDYATALADLGPSGANLIDGILAGGERYGYTWYLDPAIDPRVNFALRADPVIVGQTGDRNFFVNNTAVVHWSVGRPADATDPGVD